MSWDHLSIRKMLCTNTFTYFFVMGILVLLFCWTSVELQAKSQRSHQIKLQTSGSVNSCDGRRIFMYNLPPEFNVELISRCKYGLTTWMNFCPHAENDGLGQPHLATGGFIGSRSSRLHQVRARARQNLGTGWYKTDPYMLELVFHARMQQYPCLTTDSSTADAFFLPYYAGVDALRYLYNASMQGDSHGDKLVQWIAGNAQKQWEKYGGQDHFMVLARTSWDFYYLRNETHVMWGTGFFDSPHMSNITALLMEAKPWMKHEQAIPYLTSFHPSAAELRDWIDKVRGAERTSLFSFAGATRSHLNDSIRNVLLDQCSDSSNCTLLNCAVLRCYHNPEPIALAFMHSSFCLQPRGDTPTRRSAFDSMISGCIPVFFHNDSAYSQYSWHLPKDPHSYSVFISEANIRDGLLVEDVLRAISPKDVATMRKTVISRIPKLVYARRNGEFEDAFDVSVRKILSRIASFKRQFRAHDSGSGSMSAAGRIL